MMQFIITKTLCIITFIILISNVVSILKEHVEVTTEKDTESEDSAYIKKRKIEVQDFLASPNTATMFIIAIALISITAGVWLCLQCIYYVCRELYRIIYGVPPAVPIEPVVAYQPNDDNAQIHLD